MQYQYVGQIDLPENQRFSYPKELEDQYNPRIAGEMRRYAAIENYDANGRCISCVAFADNKPMMDHLDFVQRENEKAIQELRERRTFQPQYNQPYQAYQPQPNPQNMPSVHVRQQGFFRRMMKRVMPKLLE